jgi:hypothetical protein
MLMQLQKPKFVHPFSVFLAVFGFSNCPPTVVKSIQFWAAISNDQVLFTPDDEYDERDEVS